MPIEPSDFFRPEFRKVIRKSIGGFTDEERAKKMITNIKRLKAIAKKHRKIEERLKKKYPWIEFEEYEEE